MSSGGMEWAYRMMAMHKLDAMGLAIVLHLGWRDAASWRTDRGIARALNKDRATVRRATAALARAGVIERRSGQWVACETVAVVEETAAAPVPSPEASDETGAKVPRGREAPGGDKPPGEGASGPRKRGREAPAMRKEKIEKAREPAHVSELAAQVASESARRQPERVRSLGEASGGAERSEAAVSELSRYQRTKLRQGEAVLIGGELVRPETGAHRAWRAALQSVERCA